MSIDISPTVGSLIVHIMENEGIKRTQGPEFAAMHWTDVRKSFITGDPGMPDDVFYDLVVEAQRELYQHRKSIERMTM